MRDHVLIIAEAGVNHNGDMVLAKELIAAAAESGADFIKFQTFNAERLATREAEKAVYQKLTTDSTESQFEMLQRLELSKEMHEDLITECHSYGIRFLSTGFDILSINMLVDLGIRLFKIPSGEITNLPYLRHIGGLGDEIILSTGMADLEEIIDAISVLEQSGTSRSLITVLHCTSEYPAPMNEVNLRAMLTIRNKLGVKVGYSDHTQGFEVAIAAVALGATLIEKHFTLDRELPGPDHRASLEPNELKAMVKGIRNIELAMGDGIKRCSPSEAKNRNIVRKSIVAVTQIKTGEVFSDRNLAVKRPGSGISPMLWDNVIGQNAKRDFGPDEIIKL